MIAFDHQALLHREGICIPKGAHVHLGVFAEPFLSCIYNGKKTMESRITRNRIAPWDRVRPGDLVLIKRSSGPVEAVFTVGAVQQFDLTSTPITHLQEHFSSVLCADAAFWQRKQSCRYAVLMEITALHRIPPVLIEKRGMQSWLVLG